MVKNKRAFLVGMPGAGKTTFASVLSRQLKLKALDLDTYILSQNPSYDSIKTIFEHQGASFFRQLERHALEKVAQREGYLIATGGGTPCFFDNMDFMLEHGLTIFLNAAVEDIYQHIQDNSTRPLFEGYSAENLLKKLQAMHAERLPFYQRAHIVFNANYLKYFYENLLTA